MDFGNHFSLESRGGIAIGCYRGNATPDDEPKILLTSCEKTDDGLPAIFMVGDRIYRIHTILTMAEEATSGHVMHERGLRINAAMTKDDADYICDHRDNIPAEYRHLALAFPESVGHVWAHDSGDYIHYLWYGYLNHRSPKRNWHWGGRKPEGHWGKSFRLVSREDFPEVT